MEFDTLFADVYPALFRYCERHTGDPDLADDLAQEAFVRLVEREVRGEREELRMWLFTVVGNLISDRHRAAETHRRLVVGNLEPPPEPSRPDAEAERAEGRRVVRTALDGLDAREKRLLLMRQEGFSYREIAEAVGVAVGSVGPLLARAEEALVAQLEDLGYGHDSFV